MKKTYKTYKLCKHRTVYTRRSEAASHIYIYHLHARRRPNYFTFSTLRLYFLTNTPQTESSSHNQKFLAGDNYLDEIDLDLKYEKKPEQLANIKKNAQSFFCEVRCCQLWADPEYKGSNETNQGSATEKNARSTRRKRTWSRKPSRPDRAGVALESLRWGSRKPKRSRSRSSKPTARRRSRLSRAPFGDYDKSQVIQNFIPATVHQIVKEASSKLEADVEALKMMLEPEWNGKFQDVHDPIHENYKELLAANKKYSVIYAQMELETE